MEKNISIVKAEGDASNIQDLAILPGTTAREILQQVGLPDNGYNLTDGKQADPFTGDDNVYEQVEDGAKLYASANVTVG